MYSLNIFVKKTEGVNGTVLMDTVNSRILDLDREQADMLRQILTAPIDLNNSLLTKLLDEQWIIESDSQQEQGDHYYHFDLEPLGNFKLSKIIIELSTTCGLNCSFCNTLDNSAKASCICKKWDYKKEDIDYKNLIEALLPFDPEKIIILGGDPFYEDSNKLLQLLTIFHDLNFRGNIVIYTNGSNLNKSIIKKLSNFKNIKVNIQLFGLNEAIYAKITGRKNNLEKVIHNIRCLRENGIQTIATLFIINSNNDQLDQAAFPLQDLPIGIKYIYDKKLSSPELINDANNRMFLKDYGTYQLMEHTNCCLYKQIFISSDLKIYPCPYLRDFLLGDLKINRIDEILREGTYEKYWYLHKKKIEPCSKCKYHLLCFDCRGIEYPVNQDLYHEHYCHIANELEKEQ